MVSGPPYLQCSRDTSTLFDLLYRRGQIQDFLKGSQGPLKGRPKGFPQLTSKLSKTKKSKQKKGFTHRRTRQGAGGGATALPNMGKTVGKIWAKHEEKK